MAKFCIVKLLGSIPAVVNAKNYDPKGVSDSPAQRSFRCVIVNNRDVPHYTNAIRAVTLLPFSECLVPEGELNDFSGLVNDAFEVGSGFTATSVKMLITKILTFFRLSGGQDNAIIKTWLAENQDLLEVIFNDPKHYQFDGSDEIFEELSR